MAKLVLDEPITKPRLVLDEPQPDFGMIALPRKKLPGVWDFDRQLDTLLGDPEKPIEDFIPLDVKHDFGRIIGMTEKPDETKDRMKNSLYYSIQFGIPPSLSYNIIDGLMDRTKFNPLKAKPEERGFFGKIAESWRRGDAQVMGDISIYETAFEGRGDEERALAALKKLQLEQALDPIEGWFLADLVYSGVEVMPGMARGYWSAIPNAFAGMSIGAGMALAAGQIPPLTLAPEEIVGVPAGALVGAKYGLMTGSATFWYKQGAGSMYAAMREKDYNPELSKHIAGAAAVPYAIVEFLQVAQLTPGLRRGALNVAKKSMLRVVANATKRYGTTWGTEVFEEVVQEIIQVVAEDTAGFLSDKLKLPKGVSEFLLERGRRIWATTKEAAKAMALLPIPGATIDIYTGKRAIIPVEKKPEIEPRVIEVKAPEVVVPPEIAELTDDELFEKFRETKITEPEWKPLYTEVIRRKEVEVPPTEVVAAPEKPVEVITPAEVVEEPVDTLSRWVRLNSEIDGTLEEMQKVSGQARETLRDKLRSLQAERNALDIGHKVREMTPEEIAEDEEFQAIAQDILDAGPDKVNAALDILERRIGLLTKVSEGVLTQEEADILTAKFVAAAKARIPEPRRKQVPSRELAKPEAVGVAPEAKLIPAPMGYIRAVKNAKGKYEIKLGRIAPDNPFNNEIFTGEFDTPQIARKSYEAWFMKQQVVIAKPTPTVAKAEPVKIAPEVKKRLRDAQKLLNPQTKRAVGAMTFDAENQRLISKDGKIALQYYPPNAVLPDGTKAGSTGTVRIESIAPTPVVKAEPVKPKVKAPKELLGGLPVEPPGLTKAEVEHLGKREQDALRAAQARGLKVGYKKGAAETIADARRSLDAFRIKEAISQKGKMDVASVVLTYVPKEKQGDYIRRILEAKTQKRIERLTEAIDKYLDKYEMRQAIRSFKNFVKDIKRKYRRGEVALGQLPKRLGDAIIEVLDKFDLAKISEKKEETLESRLKFVTRISGELAKGFEQLNEGMDKDATDLLMMGTIRIDELKRLSQEFIGDLDTEQIEYIHASLEHLIKINEKKAQSKERRRMEALRTDLNNARQEVLPAKAVLKTYTGILGAIRWIGVEGSSTLRTLVGLATGKENTATRKLLIEELDKANNQRKETYKGFIMYFKSLLKKKGLQWSDIRNLQDLTKITIGGKVVELDYDNLLALYAHTQAEGNLRRLLKTKGLNITVYTRDKYSLFTKKEIYRVGKPTLAELRAVAEKVPEDHKKLLDVYFKTNHDKQAPAINETSMAYQNYELARLEKYWHISREIDKVVEGKKADISISINRQGRYLPRTGGNLRINIRPFSLEVMNGMQSDAAYHTMTIPMENARTLVANTKWREAMKKAGQQRALDEITRMLRRTQGLISDQSIIELTASRLLGTVGKSILSARLSGGLVQTASVPAAVEFIDKKYLVQIDVPTPANIKHLKDISPVLWMRWEAKQFDYALGMVGAESAFETLLFEHRPLTDNLLMPYTIGDEVAIAKLFMAAERQIEAETKLNRGTDEFQNASLELLYQAMNTQPQWDMIHRSPITSDPSILVRSITMFMSARNAQYNVLVRAMDDYRKGRITKGQRNERLAGVGMANLFVSVARHTFKTAITAGAITVFTAMGLRKAPDEEEIKKEIVRLGKKIPLETVFNLIGLNTLGTLFTSMAYAALKTRKYGWGAGRYGDIRTGNMMADLMLDFMQLGIDFTMFTDQIISGEKYKSGKNRGRYKWEITGLRLIDGIALVIAYRFGLPYEGPKSDIIWPVQKALPEKKVSPVSVIKRKE